MDATSTEQNSSQDDAESAQRHDLSSPDLEEQILNAVLKVDEAENAEQGLLKLENDDEFNPTFPAALKSSESNEKLLHHGHHITETTQRLKQLLKEHWEAVHIQQQIRDVADKFAHSPRRSIRLDVHFPGVDRERISRLEELLIKESKYLIHSNPTFCTFLRQNCDPRTLQLDRKREVLRQFTLVDIVVLCLLSSALLLTSPARGHLNSLAGLIIDEDPSFGYSPARHGEVLYYGSIATAVGRIVSGFIIDLHDPLHIFGGFSIVSALFVILISQLHQITLGYDSESRYAVFITLYVLNVFAQSAIFASGVKFLHDHFRSAQYGRSLVIYSIGGRLGSIIAGVAMGNVHNGIGLDWPTGSLIAALMCFGSVIPLVLIKRFPHPADHLVAPDHESFTDKLQTFESSAPPRQMVHVGLPKCDANSQRQKWFQFKEALKRLASWWQRRSFVLMAGANAGMAVGAAGEGFEGLQSLFTGKVLHIPRGLPSASVTVFFHLGSILSLVIGGIFIERLSRPSQSRVVLLMMTTSCFASIGLIALTATAQNIVSPSDELAAGARSVYFFLGFGLGYPFFVTVQKFAMNFGGSHAGLVSQTLGLFATAVCAIANGAFGAVASRSFPAIAVILTIFLSLGWFCMLLFDFFEWLAKIKLKHFYLAEAVVRVFHHQHIDEDRLRRKRLLLQANEQSFSKDIGLLLSRRPDATYRGLSLLWSAFTFSLAVLVVCSLFLSYYWVRNPSSLF